MKYLVFKLEAYYPSGGLGDLFAYAQDDEGLKTIIRKDLKESKESIVKDRDVSREEIEEYELEREYEEKHGNDTNKIDSINRSIKYRIESLNETYDVNRISLYYDYQVIDLYKMKAYEIREEDLLLLLNISNDDPNDIDPIDLSSIMIDDCLTNDKIEDIFKDKKINIK